MKALLSIPVLLLAAGPSLDDRLPPLSSFTAMVERPLFIPSRQGTAPVQAPPAIAGQERRLIGIASRGGRQMALLLVDGAGRSLLPGQELDGWRLLSVEPGAARFAAPDGSSLRLAVGGSLP